MSERIPLPSDEELGPAHSLAVHAVHNWNDARMFAGAGELFVPIATLATVIFKARGVDDRLRELIALRVAALLHSEFMWTANERMGVNAGVTADEIAAVRRIDGPPSLADPEANLMLTAVDEITRDGSMTEATVAQFRRRYDDELCRKYIAVMAYFNFFARFVESTGVPVETPDDLDRKVGNRTSPV